MAGFWLPEGGATWVFAGDSITQGIVHTHGARSWVEHVHERVRWQLDRLEDVVINSGVSGWRAPAMVAGYERFVGRYRPDVVSFAFGANDALAGPDGLGPYRDALTELARRARDGGAQVVLHTPNPVSTTAVGRADSIPAYADEVRQVAARLDLILVDHRRHWTDRFGDADPIAWLDDHTHPNAAGHREMAGLTLRTLGLGDLEES